MKTSDVLNLLNDIAPFKLAESWDNSGLQAGSPDWDAARIMVALDVTLPLMRAAQKKGCGLVITHHPLMISPEKSLDFSRMPGSAIKAAARNRISIISAHTNLDKADQGLNDYFAYKLGIQTGLPLLPDDSGPEEAGMITGIGRFGTLAKPLAVRDLALQTRQSLGIDKIRLTGDPDREVRNVAICTGSGGSLVDTFVRSEAEVFITGDVKYHEARDVEEAGKAIIDAGHFGSEHLAIELIAARMKEAGRKAGLSFEILEFLEEKDPFIIV